MKKQKILKMSNTCIECGSPTQDCYYVAGYGPLCEECHSNLYQWATEYTRCKGEYYDKQVPKWN